MLHAVAHLQGVDAREQGRDMEDIAEDQAEAVDFQWGKVKAGERGLPYRAVLDADQIEKPQGRQQDQQDLARPLAQKGQEQGAEQQGGGRVQLSHNSLPRA